MAEATVCWERLLREHRAEAAARAEPSARRWPVLLVLGVVGLVALIGVGTTLAFGLQQSGRADAGRCPFVADAEVRVVLSDPLGGQPDLCEYSTAPPRAAGPVTRSVGDLVRPALPEVAGAAALLLALLAHRSAPSRPRRRRTLVRFPRPGGATG